LASNFDAAEGLNNRHGSLTSNVGQRGKSGQPRSAAAPYLAKRVKAAERLLTDQHALTGNSILMRRKDSERPALLSGRQRASPSHIWGCLLNTGFWKACRKASVGPLEGLARNDFPRHHLAMHPSLINKGRPSTSARAMPFLVQTLDHAKPREPLTTPRVIRCTVPQTALPKLARSPSQVRAFFGTNF